MALDLEATARFIAAKEAFRSKVYRDSGGVETIGYGETRREIINRYRETGIPQPAAWELLKTRVLEFNRMMRAQLGDMPLSANQEGALTSLVYNIGPGGPDARQAGWHDSPVLAALRRGDFAAAARAFAHHNRAGGQVVRGLTNRRQEEAAWFQSGGSAVSAKLPAGKPGLPTFEQVKAAFEKWNGTVEGPGNNETIFNKWYFGRDAREPWCATFVSYVLYHVGIPVPATTTKGFAYTPSGAAWFRKKGKWTRTPTVGSVVFFHWPSMGRIAHVGWVVKVDPDGSFWSWEGNTDVKGGRTGGRVILQHRSAVSIGKTGGFGLLDYGAATASRTKEEDVIRIITTTNADGSRAGVFTETNLSQVAWVPNPKRWDLAKRYAVEGVEEPVLVPRDEFDLLTKMGPDVGQWPK